MSNFFDYLKWRGDLTFKQDEINEIDIALFTQIVMIPYSIHIEMPLIDTDKKITLNELGKLVNPFKKSYMEKIGLILPSEIINLLLLMSESKRYKDVIISNYVSDICIKKEIQFTAFTVDISKDLRLVIYSGTDDSIIGWKENFKMMFKYPTEAQKASVLYLERVSNYKKLIIAGHSKGGNLSIYSGLHIENNIFKKIKKIYNLDGPGLTENLVLNKRNERRFKKMYLYAGQTAIVGYLFNQYENEIVVHSNNVGLYQHDLFSWEIEGNRFKRHPNRSKDGIYIENKLNKMLEKMDSVTKEEFVDIAFRLLMYTKSDNLTELNKKKFKIIKSYLNIDRNSKKLINKILLELVVDKVIFKNLFLSIREKNVKKKIEKKMIKNTK